MKDEKFFNPELCGNVDVEANTKNRSHRHAYELIEEITDLIGYNPFTIEDLRWEKSLESHLQILVDDGVLTFDGDTSGYELNPTSQKLISFLEGTDSEEEQLKILNPYRYFNNQF